VLHLGQPSVAVLGVGAILYGETSPAGRTIQTIYQQLGESCLFFFGLLQTPNFWIFGRKKPRTKINTLFLLKFHSF